ncbi:unnamed protein product [Amoebophrya sp. A120]|nr:unnamed protein product [Amoebophrya sp. A120]|eukprot:GSA120T00020139001.1
MAVFLIAGGCFISSLGWLAMVKDDEKDDNHKDPLTTNLAVGPHNNNQTQTDAHVIENATSAVVLSSYRNPSDADREGQWRTQQGFSARTCSAKIFWPTTTAAATRAAPNSRPGRPRGEIEIVAIGYGPHAERQGYSRRAAVASTAAHDHHVTEAQQSGAREEVTSFSDKHVQAPLDFELDEFKKRVNLQGQQVEIVSVDEMMLECFDLFSSFGCASELPVDIELQTSLALRDHGEQTETGVGAHTKKQSCSNNNCAVACANSCCADCVLSTRGAITGEDNGSIPPGTSRLVESVRSRSFFYGGRPKPFRSGDLISSSQSFQYAQMLIVLNKMRGTRMQQLEAPWPPTTCRQTQDGSDALNFPRPLSLAAPARASGLGMTIPVFSKRSHDDQWRFHLEDEDKSEQVLTFFHICATVFAMAAVVVLQLEVENRDEDAVAVTAEDEDGRGCEVNRPELRPTGAAGTGVRFGVLEEKRGNADVASYIFEGGGTDAQARNALSSFTVQDASTRDEVEESGLMIRIAGGEERQIGSAIPGRNCTGTNGHDDVRHRQEADDKADENDPDHAVVVGREEEQYGTEQFAGVASQIQQSSRHASTRNPDAEADRVPQEQEEWSFGGDEMNAELFVGPEPRGSAPGLGNVVDHISSNVSTSLVVDEAFSETSAAFGRRERSAVFDEDAKEMNDEDEVGGGLGLLSRECEELFRDVQREQYEQRRRNSSAALPSSSSSGPQSDAFVDDECAPRGPILTDRSPGKNSTTARQQLSRDRKRRIHAYRLELWRSTAVLALREGNMGFYVRHTRRLKELLEDEESLSLSAAEKERLHLPAMSYADDPFENWLNEEGSKTSRRCPEAVRPQTWMQMSCYLRDTNYCWQWHGDHDEQFLESLVPETVCVLLSLPVIPASLRTHNIPFADGHGSGAEEECELPFLRDGQVVAQMKEPEAPEGGAGVVANNSASWEPAGAFWIGYNYFISSIRPWFTVKQEESAQSQSGSGVEITSSATGVVKKEEHLVDVA